MGLKKGEQLRTAFETYSVEKQIGAGGSGEVYEIRDSENVGFGAKILDPTKASAVRLKRFRNEIHFCTKNTHRNIVQVRASGITDKGATFYVMPLYPATLRDLISKGIPSQDVLGHYGQILDGVEAAHLQGVWHRDIKPENILFSPDSNLFVVADFGIAHFEEEELFTAVETRNDERLANFLYSAPEQRTRGQTVDSKADVYALGLILNEMFSGVVPQGTAFRRVSDVAPDYSFLDGLIEVMLRQERTSRPSIEDIKRELIGRGNAFLSTQHLNTLKSEVVPDTEVDDPIVRNPIRILAADFQDEQLIFTLSGFPPPDWIGAFQHPRSGQWQSYQGAGPEYFTFQGKYARVPVSRTMDAQQLVDMTKSYVDMANSQYKQMVIAANSKRLEAERETLRKKIAEEEHRQKVLSQIKL